VFSSLSLSLALSVEQEQAKLYLTLNLQVTPNWKVVCMEPGNDWKSSPMPIPHKLDTGYRIDPEPPVDFSSRELDLITKTYKKLKQLQDPVYINSTDVMMYDLLTVAELADDVRDIVRTAVSEKSGDMWSMFGKSDRKPITVELVQLKMLDMADGHKMVIHTDDLHHKSLNFNRHLTVGQSTAFPKPGSELALAYDAVRTLDLDEQVLAEHEDPDSRQIRDERLRTAISTIPIPTPDHMADMQSKYVRPGGSSTFMSCVFHTVPVAGITDTEEEPVKRPRKSNRLVLFHSFIVKGTAARNLDCQYTPSILPQGHCSPSQFWTQHYSL
jgi:hypothetical protein